MTPKNQSARLRRLRHGYFGSIGILLLAGVLVLGGLTLLIPGYVRLAVMQPARDLIFFERELQPLSNYSDIERQSPKPTETIVLPGGIGPQADIDIALDAWLPSGVRAPTVLLLHGSSPRGRQLGFNMLLAQRLQQQGWLVLTPDARGFGDSGSPVDPNDPEAWPVTRDLERLVAYARQHPRGDGTVVAVGHSLGGSHLLTLDIASVGFSALALIGPSRHSSEIPPTWWERVRFSSDRMLPRALSPAVVAAEMRRQDILRIAAGGSSRVAGVPVLLMDGEREGERLITVLREAASGLGPQVKHATVPGSHHYCSAYQLPWPGRTVYVRPAIFDLCFDTLQAFLVDAVAWP